MIDIKELRVGNLVMTNNSKYRKEQNGKVAYITQIDSERNFEEIKCTVSIYLIDDEWKDTYGQWLNFIEPIQISQEWLLKFGFEIETYDEGAFYTKKGEYNFDLDGHFDYHRSDGSWIKIKYVHQLQNLYFALTQTELTYES